MAPPAISFVRVAKVGPEAHKLGVPAVERERFKEPVTHVEHHPPAAKHMTNPVMINRDAVVKSASTNACTSTSASRYTHSHHVNIQRNGSKNLMLFTG